MSVLVFYKHHEFQVVTTKVNGGHKWLALIEGHEIGTPHERLHIYKTADQALDAGIKFAQDALEKALTYLGVNQKPSHKEF
ncbi:hypothetical protein LG201_13895 [Methylobacillus gramineus]|uniref:hypothetical protein n=1 Tax=Methylobacillus gramineus TaxID=755169 RepID=UPI001CFFF5F0|nr:hypothetical protein [Methylobacillus gramineus]MCB5186303.1 hypothetical protein [Methylobacillus gramineus]